MIIVQGIKPQDIYAAQVNQSGRSGDILVLNDPNLSELIVHRAVGILVVDGQTEFVTQGDGKAEVGIGPGPRSHTIPEKAISKVVVRIHWICHLALFVGDKSIVCLLLAVTIIHIAVELGLSILAGNKTQAQKGRNCRKKP